MNKLVCSFVLTAIFSCSLAQETPISSPLGSCLFYQTDSNGRIFRDNFENLLDVGQIDILEETIITQVSDLNLCLGELCKTWTDVKGSGKYSSEASFLDEQKRYTKKALGLFLYDGNKGVENVLKLYRVYQDTNGSYYRWKKKKGNNDEYYKVPALHVVCDDKGILRDSVYEDVTIPAARVWVMNEYSSNKNSPTVKQYLNNLQATSKQRVGRIKFNGGNYCFTPNFIWNGNKNRYEGTVECWQEHTYKNLEGTLYTEKILFRINLYMQPTTLEFEGGTYISWMIKFGNISVLETTSI